MTLEYYIVLEAILFYPSHKLIFSSSKPPQFFSHQVTHVCIFSTHIRILIYYDIYEKVSLEVSSSYAKGKDDDEFLGILLQWLHPWLNLDL